MNDTTAVLPALGNLGYEVFLILLGFALVWLWGRYILRKVRKSFRKGELRDEVVLISNFFDEQRDGSVLLKPRTVQSAEPLLRAFPNPYLADLIVTATKKASPSNPFIILANDEDHRIFMKRTVDLVSELGADGHIHRMCGLPIIKAECYVCITFSADGEHRKIRVDMVSADDLRKLNDPRYLSRITNRPEEGSHADLVAIFQECARLIFELGENVPETRKRVRRVSLPLAV